MGIMVIIFRIMGNAGFISSAVGTPLTKLPSPSLQTLALNPKPPQRLCKGQPEAQNPQTRRVLVLQLKKEPHNTKGNTLLGNYSPYPESPQI